MNPLDAHLERLAQTPVLLVASDYDGTLSPLVEDPRQARAHPDALVALRNLSLLPQTHVAVISGRALRDLSALAAFPEDVHLVGSHGSEFDLGFSRNLPEEQLRLRKFLDDRLREIAAEDPGFYLEEKPGSLAFHYRNADPERAREAMAEIETDLVGRDGVSVQRGKMVIELGVVETSKGSALDAIRNRVGASAAIYLGDDETDEEAFARLTGPDLAIKVGEGETRAPHRIADPTEAARHLARLFELREQWLSSDRFADIETHSYLSDLRTAALVAPGGRVVWFCAPRLDSNALFAELLGGPPAGQFTIHPAGDDSPGTAQYRDGTMVLETRWTDLTLTDFLDCSWERTLQRPGRTDLVRILEGRGEVEICFAPRLDFGRFPTQIAIRENGLEVEDVHDPIVLHAPGVTWRIEEAGPHQTAIGRLTLDGTPRVLELRYGTGNLDQRRLDPIRRRDETARFWSTWVDGLEIPGNHRDAVRRSALVLKALCYGPTGSIAAAPTTSLPEHVGGIRNWDYRFCWLRDAALTAASLVRLGSFGEAMRFLDWMLALVEEHDGTRFLSPVYTLSGSALPSEAEITDLPGYRGSRPVRVGNAASGQIQLDVFGPVVDLVHLIMEREAPITAEHWRLVNTMVQRVEERWDSPDHGIWELRGQRRHHVHSKVMCWVTVDRACRIAREYLGRPRPEWAELRDRIADDVRERGWNAERGAYTTAYGLPDLDASVLEIGLRGLVSGEDPKFRATVEAVDRELRRGPTVYRYRFDDGLPGFEGGLHICTAWLIQSLVLIGERERAEELFEEMLALAGPTGLLSEEYGPRTRRALGNHPQAYSHLGVIDAALCLATDAERRRP